MPRQTALSLLVLLLSLSGLSACSGWDPQDKARAELETGYAIDQFKQRDPGIRRFFDNAFGYAVFPTVGKGAAGLGGAYGKGVLFEQGSAVGEAKLIQVTIGFQWGGQAYRELIFFEHQDDLERFKRGELELSAQASAVAITLGASASADYERGVAVFTMTKGGLMYEASIGGQKFSFRPY